MAAPRFLLRFSAVLLAVVVPHAQAAAFCELADRAAAVTVAVTATGAALPEDEAWARALLDALTDPAGQPASLERAIARVPAAAAHDPLVTRARVTLAAIRLTAGQYDDARSVLRQVGVDTPLSLDAGLLMAESHALQHDLRQAVRWNLRVARQWADEPAALDALVQRAAALGATDRALAGAALAEARDRALLSLRQLDALADTLRQDHWFSRWATEPEAPAIDPALAAVFYRVLASDAFQAARFAAIGSQAPAWCAREQHARLLALAEDLATLESDVQQSVTAIERRLTLTRAAYDQSRARFMGNPGADPLLGQQVNRLRNAVARDEADLVALRGNLQSLAPARARLAGQAAHLEAAGFRVQAEAAAAVSRALEEALASRRARLRDAAGAASLALGELQDPRGLRDAQHLPGGDPR